MRGKQKVFGIGRLLVSTPVALSLVLSGCATTNVGVEGGDSGTSGRVLGSVIGAVLGAVVDKGNPARGAIAGAAIGFAAGWGVDQYRSTQIKSSKQVADEHVRSFGSLPSEPALKASSSRFLPTDQVMRGRRVSRVSDIEVVRGVSTAVVAIREEVVLYDPQGTEVTRIAKSANESGGQAGRYRTEFTLTLPEGIPQGVYPVKSTIFLNGRAARTDEMSLTVV